MSSDGIDNDADSLIDYPTDPGCLDHYDTSEFNNVIINQSEDE